LKILSKPISVVSVTDYEGCIQPLRMKITGEDCDEIVVKLSVSYFEKQRQAGNYMFVYRCKGEINSIMKEFEIKYELNSCKWILWKI
jgi:hypothetical protein